MVRCWFACDPLVAHLWFLVGSCAMLLVRSGSLLVRWCFAVGSTVILDASLVLSWFVTGSTQIPLRFTCDSLVVRC